MNSEYWRCVFDRFLESGRIWVGVSLVAVIGLAVICLITSLVAAGVSFLPCFLAGLGFLRIAALVGLIWIFLWSMLMCAVSTGIFPGSAAVAGALPPDFGRGIDCPTAQAELAAARRELDNARESLDEAEAATRRARRRLEAALVAAGLSVGAIVGGILNPGALVAAIFASAAALALVARRGRALARAVRRELEARAALATIEAKVAALQALVNALCPRVDITPIDDDDSPGGITPVDGTPSVIT